MNASLALLKDTSYLAYWCSGLISGLGDSMFLLALNWMVVQKTGSGLTLGTLMACISLPQILFATVGGAIVDRLNPKMVMIASDAVRGLVMVFLIFASVGGVPAIWMLFCMGIIFGCVDGIFFPARSSFQQRLVSADRYTQSFGLLMVGAQTAAILGPVLGGALVSKGSYQIVIAANALSFFISALLLLFSRPFGHAAVRARGKKSMASDIKDAIRFLFGNHLILTTSLSAFIVNACVQATTIAIPFLANQSHIGGKGFGLMNMGLGIGGAVAAIFFALVRIKNPTPRMTFFACFIEGITFMALAFSQELWLLVGMMLLIGFMEVVVNTIAPSINQKIIPPHMTGRVISLMIVFMSASEPLARAFSGWVIQGSGVTVLLLCSGAAEMVVAIGGFFMPSVRNYSFHLRKAQTDSMLQS